jgi:hypothetical protein
MKTTVYISGGLLVLLLGGAFWRYTSPEAAKKETADIVVLDARKDDISSISWHEEKLDVAVHMKSDELGSYAWVDLVEHKKKKVGPNGETTDVETPNADAPSEEPAKEDLAAKPAETEVVEDVKSTFKGGDAATKLFEGFEPLKAKRLLEKVPADKLKELGLDVPASWIEVERRGKTRKLEVGGETWGTKDRYVRDTDTGKIYLVAADTLRPLQFAKSRLPDRGLSDLKTEKLVKVRLDGSTGAVEMVQGNREDKDKAFWASASAPDESIEMYSTWLDKILKLKSLSYVAPDETPASPAPAFRLTLFPESGTPQVIEFLQANDDKGDTEYYARGNYIRGLVKLQRTVMADTVADVPAVVAAKPGDVLPDEGKEKGKDKDGARSMGGPRPPPMVGGPPHPGPGRVPPPPGVSPK